MKRFFLYFLLVFLIAAAAFSIWYFVFRERKEDRVLILYGNVDVRQVNLGFKVSGRIKKLLFEEGDVVAKGDVVAILEKEPYLDRVKEANASLLSIKASLKNAEELLQRRERLRVGGGVSQEDYENALSSRDVDLAKLEESEASLGIAETNLKDTEIINPTDGTILTRVREPGSVVNVGDTVYTVSILSPVWIRAYVTEPELGKIYPGMKAKIYTDTENLKVYEGHIGFISPVSEFTPKTVETSELRTDLVYRIRVIADNPDRYLKQGMPVTVELDLSKTDEKKDAA